MNIECLISEGLKGREKLTKRRKERELEMENIAAVITQERAKISCNFEQVEKALQERLSEYEGAVFTEDSKTIAKKHVASLRAEKKSLQDNLRNAKKEYMKEWDRFEPQAKELIGMYDPVINLINDQVQAFEEKRLSEKKQLISEIYASVPEDVQPFIPLERIYNPKWENATYKEKSIREDINEIVDRTRNDINTINSMNSDSVLKALETYKRNLNLSDAITYINNYERQKQEILERERERKRMEEEERIRCAEREKIIAEQRAKEELQRVEEEKAEALRQAEREHAAALDKAREEAARECIDSMIPESDGDAELYEYRISLSADAKEKLEMYMDSVGIEWEMI